jgi:pimeloyl-ACP methyl ester carboxylesterase
VKPFFFGPTGASLFGIYHPPTATPVHPRAVLLCNPFGQEAVRTHRIYRVLATRLAKLGFPVLRFDYYGTGDSAGDSSEGNQAQWVEDIITAHQQALTASGAARVSWVGLRYGATLMALAAERGATGLADLVLWDPVVDGAAYLRDLKEAHAAFLRDDLVGWRPAVTPIAEALGFPLGPQLARELEALNLATRRKLRASQLTVLTSKRTPELDALKTSVEAWDVATQWDTVAISSTWNSEEAMNASLVPIEMVDAIVTRLQGRA